MAGMEDHRGDMNDSQDPESNNAVVPSLEMGAAESVAVDDGMRDLNLELTMNVSAPSRAGQNVTDDSKVPHDELIMLVVNLFEQPTPQKIDARTVALEERMLALERPMFQTGKSVTEIQSLLTEQKGSPTVTGTISCTAAGTVAVQGATIVEKELSAHIEIGNVVTNAFGSRTEVQKSFEKGKGVSMTNTISSLDIIVPNSPDFDDDVIIDEALSTPRPKHAKTRSGFPKGSLSHYWCSGLPKRTCITSAITHESAVVACEKVFMDLHNVSQFDCTSKVCELFSLPEKCNSPLKIPKLEPIDSKPIHAAEKHLTSQHTTAVNTSQASMRTAAMQGFHMVFRPTVHMDLTYEDCKTTTYIFRKNDQYLEVLFKFSKLEVPRAGFHSLSPVYMPNVDIMNIMFMNASMRACCVVPPHVWYTPSLFADDVLALRLFEVIMKRYLNRWMPATSRLEHVFVPVCEPTYTWYLMVVDVKHVAVYCLDVTRAPEHTERRECNMQTILLMLANILKLDRNLKNFTHVSADPTTWGPVQFPDGVPCHPDCNDSCLWMLNWLQMEGKFAVANLPWQLRMKTATKIVLLECNEVRAVVDSKAEAAWKKLVRTNE